MPVGELYNRWKSANQIGGAIPTLRVTVTRGLIDRDYKKFVPLGGSKTIPFKIEDGNNAEPWQGFWRATGEPKELPNVLSVKWTKDFTQKGTGSAVIEVENIIYKAIVGIGGIYHGIMRGYLSPWLGLKLAKRVTIPSWVENEWFEVLDNGYKIDVYEGYGNQQKRTFTGLIEEADLETLPDRITITARNFGVLMTDQRVVGYNKPPEIASPLQIGDRERSLGIKPKGPAMAVKNWVLVDDMSDIAKAVFLWMGFKEWEVESMGWSPVHPMAWNLEKFFIDMLTDIQAQANWLFYLKKPSPSEESLGVPCFVHNTATDPAPRTMLEVRDSDLLESVKVKVDLSNLPYIIRFRGNVDPSGVTTDGDLVKRYAGTYFPPWSGAGPYITQAGRTSGVRRHELTVDPNLYSDEECVFGAILAALQYALAAYTAEVQISGYPDLDLNEQISVVDETTAVNSRLWIASIASEHTTGPNGSWKMTLGGSLLDGMDMQQLKSDLAAAKVIVEVLRKNKVQIIGEPVF